MIQHIDPAAERRTGSGARAPGTGADAARAHPAPAGDEKVDPLESAFANLCAIGENMRRLLVLRAERRRLRIRKWILAGITLALVLIALIPLVIAGVNRLVTGMAEGFASLFGGRSWLGDLTTGVVILGGLALFVLAIRSWLARKGLWKKEADLGIDAQ
jgi:uncharacterized membrane protein